MQEVKLKIKISKNKNKKHYSLFPLMGSSGGVETKQKQNGSTLQHINRIFPLPHRKLCSGHEPWPALKANRGTHRPGPVAVTRVGGEKPRLVQNAISTNCGG